MTYARLFFIMLCFAGFTACTPSLRSLEKTLEKQRYTKTKIQFLKRNEKIMAPDPGARFVEARFHADSANPDFQIDTAYAQVRHARRALENTDEKQQRELDKLGWADSTFRKVQRKIERNAFAYFRQLDTERGYQAFRNRFPAAPETEAARARQHGIAFAEASRADTYQSYRRFFKKYPEAEQVNEARAKYEILLFQEKTKDRSLSSYENFLRQYPNTPYRRQVEQEIYRLAITDAERETYEAFIQNYPDNPFVRDAWEWVWWRSPDKSGFLLRYAAAPDRDAFAERALRLKKHFFPFGKNGKIGFISTDGKAQLGARFPQTSADLRCNGAIGQYGLPVRTTEGKQGAVSLLDSLIADTIYTEIAEVGDAVLKVCNEEGCGLLRKDGKRLTDLRFENILPLKSGLLAFRQNGQWGVMTQNYRVALAAEYDTITDFTAAYIRLRKRRRVGVVSKASLLRKLRGGDFEAPGFWPIDEWQRSHKEFMLLHNNRRWGVRHANGEQVVDFIASEIRETPGGWAVKRDGRWSLFDFKGKEIFLANAEALLIDKQGFGVRVDGKWGAISPDYRTTIKPEYDSLAFIRGGGLLWQGRRRYVFFGDTPPIDITQYEDFSIQFGSEKQPFLIIENRYGRKGVLSKDGETRIRVYYDEITLSGNYAIVARYKKRELLRLSDGKEMLPRRYDGLVAAAHGYFSLLRDRRFGIFHPEKELKIKPAYDKLLEVYDTAGVFIAQQVELGLIDKNGATLLPFLYDEIKPWQDSAAWVLRGDQWFLQSWKQGSQKPEGPFLSVRTRESDATGARLAFAYGGGKTTLWSNRRGLIVPPRYDDLWNIGTEKTPFYWAEIKLSEGFWQVDYLNTEGKVVHSQQLDEATYERLVCD